MLANLNNANKKFSATNKSTSFIKELDRKNIRSIALPNRLDGNAGIHFTQVGSNTGSTFGVVYKTRGSKAREYMNALKREGAPYLSSTLKFDDTDVVLLKIVVRPPRTPWQKYAREVIREAKIHRWVNSHETNKSDKVAPRFYFAAFDPKHHFGISVMEFLSGETLRSFQKSHRVVPREVYSTVERAFRQLWKMGCLHMDVHPNNVMLSKDKDGKMKAILIDFATAVEIPSETHRRLKSEMRAHPNERLFRVWDEVATEETEAYIAKILNAKTSVGSENSKPDWDFLSDLYEKSNMEDDPQNRQNERRNSVSALPRNQQDAQQQAAKRTSSGGLKIRGIKTSRTARKQFVRRQHGKGWQSVSSLFSGGGGGRRRSSTKSLKSSSGQGGLVLGWFGRGSGRTSGKKPQAPTRPSAATHGVLSGTQRVKEHNHNNGSVYAQNAQNGHDPVADLPRSSRSGQSGLAQSGSSGRRVVNTNVGPNIYPVSNSRSRFWKQDPQKLLKGWTTSGDSGTDYWSLFRAYIMSLNQKRVTLDDAVAANFYAKTRNMMCGKLKELIGDLYLQWFCDVKWDTFPVITILHVAAFAMHERHNIVLYEQVGTTSEYRRIDPWQLLPMTPLQNGTHMHLVNKLIEEFGNNEWIEPKNSDKRFVYLSVKTTPMTTLQWANLPRFPRFRGKPHATITPTFNLVFDSLEPPLIRKNNSTPPATTKSTTVQSVPKSQRRITNTYKPVPKSQRSSTTNNNVQFVSATSKQS